MKTLLLSIFALLVVTAPLGRAEDQDQPKQPPKTRVRTAPPPQHVNTVPRTIAQPRIQNRTFTPKVYTPNNVQPRTRTRTFTPPNQDMPRTTTTTKTDAAVANQNWRTRTRTNPNAFTPQTPQTSTTTAQSNTSVRNRNWQNRTNTNRNWQNNNTAGTFTYEQARNRFNRQRHDRSWWRSRYNRIVLFGGGYYYWDNNYWYPAYGYDPYYSTYAYDEPIYGYNNLAPGQVIASVQAALQAQGYFNDAVDGLIGPRTRAALSNFQRDHELPITAAIDGPTLQALGLN
jgi:hypothetical protein